jgi:small-conductance mechanosensitive channel
MDFETVHFMRIVVGIVGTVVGAGAGLKYLGFGLTGAVAGGIVGLIVGWNAVDLFKGRTHK